jgi:hypothetical protein
MTGSGTDRTRRDLEIRRQVRPLPTSLREAALRKTDRRNPPSFLTLLTVQAFQQLDQEELQRLVGSTGIAPATRGFGNVGGGSSGVRRSTETFSISGRTNLV